MIPVGVQNEIVSCLNRFANNINLTKVERRKATRTIASFRRGERHRTKRFMERALSSNHLMIPDPEKERMKRWVRVLG